jgi:hypothetical protein
MSQKKNKGKAKVHITDDNVYVTIDGEVLSHKEVSEYLDKEKRQKEFEDKFGKQPEKVDTIDALWSIADDMRERKEAGEFSTYMEAYRWASKHMTSNGKSFTPESLQNEYHKAKSKGAFD